MTIDALGSPPSHKGGWVTKKLLCKVLEVVRRMKGVGGGNGLSCGPVRGLAVAQNQAAKWRMFGKFFLSWCRSQNDLGYLLNHISWGTTQTFWTVGKGPGAAGILGNGPQCPLLSLDEWGVAHCRGWRDWCTSTSLCLWCRRRPDSSVTWPSMY